MTLRNSEPTLFATTRWTLVCEAAGTGDTAAAEALATLFATYWKPLYRYLRRQGRPQADAEDLVQGFLAHLLENEGLRNADPAKGRFRAFLLGSLKNFASNQWQREHRLKRGGSVPHLSLDWKSAETGLGIEPADPKSPDLLFDRDWALALLDKVLDDLAREETGLEFERWKPFLSVSSTRVPYGEIAAQFGMSEGAARVAVHRLRKRYRQRLREEIARTLTGTDQVEEEMRALFAALSH
jgi:RNA polymerase sigma-70 factor (ECF subfamily)